MKRHLGIQFPIVCLRLTRWTFLLIFFGNSSAFFLKWPWSYVYPGTTTTSAVGAATINYGFLRPAIVVQLPPTTAAPTTTTTRATTTSRNQIFINALLGSSVPVTSNNSLLLSLANALANRPVIGGVAQPYPSIVGGIPAGAQVVGGVAAPGPQFPQVIGGIAAPISPVGGIATTGAGGIVLPNGFPAGGGVVSGGIIPGLLPGILGRSAGQGKVVDSGQHPKGRIKFA